MAEGNLGAALSELQRGKPRQALSPGRVALAQAPGGAAALQLMGVAFRQLNDLAAAAQFFARAAAVSPQAGAAWGALGSVLADAADLAAARAPLRRALASEPSNGSLLATYSLVADGRSDYPNIGVLRRAVAADPQDARFRGNLAIALRRQGKLSQGESASRAALAMHPALQQVLNNFVLLEIKKRQPKTAETWANRALATDRQFAEARWNRAFVRFQLGRLEAAWEDAEARWLLPRVQAPRQSRERRWQGEGLSGGTLWLHPEQGLGDTIQFCRYAPILAARGARIRLTVPAPLLRLMQTLGGVEKVGVDDEASDDYDWHCPLLSVPGILGTTVATIPARIPYLSAPPHNPTPWRPHTETAELRVGLCWQGNPAHHDDRDRSLRLADLAALQGIDGVRLFALRKEGEAVPADWRMLDAAAWLGDMGDTAALIGEMDLVISCDSAVAHLAGALGRPVWTLVTYAPDWRWPMSDAATPWYPTMRLFRQQCPGNWAAVGDEVARTLRASIEPLRSRRGGGRS
ncbi:MAG: hypothetical protein HYR63_24665 [Proteobacteria bacterium]|nr:hypothetical protein [Pseudomonadota bacterium]